MGLGENVSINEIAKHVLERTFEFNGSLCSLFF